MVSKETLKEYEIESIYQYYDLIIDSIYDGQRKQARNYAKKLNKSQRLEFVYWLEDIYQDDIKEWFIREFI